MTNNKKEDIMLTLKRKIAYLKYVITISIKRQTELLRIIREYKSRSKDEIDKALIESKEVRKELELAKLALEDLTYAFVSNYPSMSKGIIKSLKFKSIEQYLDAKKEQGRPSIERIIDVILRVNDTDYNNKDIPVSKRLESLEELYTYDDDKENVARREHDYTKEGSEREANIWRDLNPYGAFSELKARHNLKGAVKYIDMEKIRKERLRAAEEFYYEKPKAHK